MKINSIFTFLILIIYSSQSFSSYWEGIVNGTDVEINQNGIKKNGKDIPQFRLSDIELCAYGNTNFPNSPLDYNIKDFMDKKRVYSWDNPDRWGSGGKWSMEFTRRPSINYGLDCNFRWEHFIKNNNVSKKLIAEKSSSDFSAQEIKKKRIDNSKHKKLNTAYIDTLGMSVSNTTNLKGVYVKQIEIESNAFKKGIRRGMIIYRIDTNEVNSVVELISLINSRNKPDILILANKRFYVVNLNKDLLLSMTDKSICNKAIFNGKWETDFNYKTYVKEAKRRGLTCGVAGSGRSEKKIAEKSVKEIITDEKKRKSLEESYKNFPLYDLMKKNTKLAQERALKKKLAEEKARKKKEVEEKARKKKLAEQERKRKLEQDKIVQKIKDYKRQAVNFYKDVEEFVKSGGKIDLVKLSKLFNIKPNPKKNWNSSDLKTYENLRQFMNSVSEFVTYEKQMIGERLKKSFALKDQSIAQLEKNLDDLKGLMRKMFGSSDVPKITKMISDIESSLANFNQSKANKLIVQTTNYISSKLDKPKVVENKQALSVKNLNIQDISWDKVKNDLSIKQRQFCKLTNDFYKDLRNARKSENDIRINKVHKQRQQNLDGLIPNGKIQDWIFKVIKIQQIENGSAAVILKLQCKSFVGSGQIHTRSTWRSKSNKEWRATIPYDDRRFRELEKLSAGEFVLGSGTLLEVNAFKPGQIETFYASQQIGEHPLTKDLNLEGELFLADLSYIAALN